MFSIAPEITNSLLNGVFVHPRATEGADSNPPSDHEEEGAENKAGFTSGKENCILFSFKSNASVLLISDC